MATLRTILELGIKGDGDASRKLERVGATGADSLKKIEDGAKKIPPALGAVDAALGKTEKNFAGLAATVEAQGAALDSQARALAESRKQVADLGKELEAAQHHTSAASKVFGGLTATIAALGPQGTLAAVQLGAIGLSASRFVPAGSAAADALTQVATGARNLNAALGGAGAIGTLATSMVRLTPIALGSVAAVAGLSVGFQKGVIDAGNFNKSIANLSAITGAVGADLEFLRNKAVEFSENSTASATEVAEAFKLVASARPELLSSAEALASVTKEVITLSQASGLGLAESAAALTNTLAQFGLGSDQAARAVNVLAAAAKFGKAEIPELNEALVKSGTVATSAGISFELTAATLEKLAEFGAPAEEFATGFRNVLLQLLAGAKDTNPEVQGLTQALINLGAKGFSVADLAKEFGERNAIVAQQMIQTAEAAAKLSVQVTGTGEADKLAAANTDNLIDQLGRLRDAFENLSIAAFGKQKNLTDFVRTITDAVNGLDDALAKAGRFAPSGRVLAGTAAGAAGGGLIAGPPGALVGGLVGGVGARGSEELSNAVAEIKALNEAVTAAEPQAIATSARIADLVAGVDVLATSSREGAGASSGLTQAMQAADPVTQALARANRDYNAGLAELADRARIAAIEEKRLTDARNAARVSFGDSLASLRVENAAREEALALGLKQARADVLVAARQTQAATGSRQNALLFAIEANKKLDLAEATAAVAKAETDGAAARKKAASDAEAAAKRATEANARGLEQLQELRDKDTTAALDGIAAIEAERDISYRKWAEQAEEANLTQEQLAEGYFLIWSDADKRITAERQKEADKQAEIAQRAADKAAKEAKKLADEQAAALLRPMERLADDIGDTLGDALITFVDDGKIRFDDLWDSFRNSALQAIADVVSEQLSLNIIASVTGQQQPGQLVNLFGTGPGGSGAGIFSKLYTGITDLASSIFGLGGDVQNLGHEFADADFVGPPNPADTGPTQGGVGAKGAAAGGTSGAALGAAGAILGILGVAFGTAAAVDAVRRTRRFKFTEEQVFKEANKAALDSEFGTFGKIIGADHSAAGFFLQDPKVGDRVLADILTVGTAELIRMTGTIFKPPTGGTALRANFEKFIEGTGDDGANVDFFSGNRFQRGIGQEGTRDILRQRFGSDKDTPDGAFVDAMREFIGLQERSIGLTDDQAKQFTGLAAVFRASIGEQAGNEAQRTIAIVADTLGSLADKGVSASEAMVIARQAIEALGPPVETFRTLNEFFTSGDNDIPVEDYADAVEGLAAVYFGELVPGATAARLAAQLFAEEGIVEFEALTKKVQAAAGEFHTLQPLLADLAAAVSQNPSDFVIDGVIVSDTAIADFRDRFLEAVRDATVQGFLQAQLEAAFNPVFGPLFEDQQKTIADIAEGRITPEEGAAELAQIGERFADKIALLGPVIEQTIRNVGLISSAFGLAGDSAADASEALKEAFENATDRSILGILSPDLAAQFDLEVQHRERLKAAREAGVDLTRVEYLNGLEREALAEQQAERLLSIERQADEQIARIREQFFAQAERAIEGVADKLKAFQQTPSAAVTPEAALAAAQAEFDRLAGKARGGDLGAIEDLPAAADTLAALITSLFGSTGQAAALLEPLFKTLAEISGLDPGAVKLSADAQAQIDAINADKNEQIANANKNHDEAMELYRAMLADLDAIVRDDGTLPPEPTDLGGSDGTDTSSGTPGPIGGTPPPGGGRDDGVRGNDGTRGGQSGAAGPYGASASAMQQFQATLAGLVPGGDTEQILKNLLGVGTIAEIRALGDGTGAAADIVDAIFATYVGVNSKSGFDRIVTASIEKIHTPRKFQPALGFDTGGSFQVRGPGGPDSIPLFNGGVRVSPRETVTVTTHGMDQKLGEVIRELQMSRTQLLARLGAMEAEMARMRSDQQRHRDYQNARGR